ncbi:MAG: DMT family transporter [Lysobacteraceae bacterium]|nr:MAG: DMT family transporter [Xanthomonadaceae bacterium]
MPTSSRSRGAFAALAIVTLVWSYNWIVMKQALAYSGPFAFSALRYVLGTLVLFAVLLARRASLRPPPWLPTVKIGLAQTTGFQLLVQSALVEGGAGRTALLAYTMPFWVVLLGWLLYRERPSARLWGGLAIAAAGLVLVLEPWHGLGGARSSLLALAGGLAWACGVVWTKRLFQRGGISALSLTAWQMAIGTLGVVVVALLVPERTIAWTPWFIGALAYNALLASGLAWLLWSIVVERLPANIAGLSSLVIPVAGIGFAWWLLGERPSALEAIGIALIAAALALVSLRPSRRVAE